MTLECTLDLDHLSGRVELSERGEQETRHDFTSWRSRELVSNSVDDESLSLICRDGGVRFYTHMAHIENKETQRAFHVTVDFNLNWQDVAHLYDFLGMLLKWEKEL